jgi:catechol 2,3-dioxygenase-like lactoylglutathione lyase family enzyme
VITGFQHIGIGVHDVDKTYAFWRKNLCFKAKLNDHTGYDEQMEPILGDKLEMRMLMAMNVAGGGAIEIVQHTSTKPKEPPAPLEWGDIGILDVGVKVFQIDAVCADLKNRGVEFATPVRRMKLDTGGTVRFAYLRDPDGLLVQLVEDPAGKRPRVGGVVHVTIGVRDIDRARDFYAKVLGFDRVLLETDELTGADMDEITGGKKTRMVILSQPSTLRSALPVLEPGSVRLVQTPDYSGKPTFERRRWGDIGCMEFALDVADVKSTYDSLVALGAEPYVPPTHMDMGSGSVGSFAYVKDPDGNTVEMVEVNKVMFVPPSVMRNVLYWPMKAAARAGIL